MTGLALTEELLAAFHGVLGALHQRRLAGWVAGKLTMPQFKVLVLVTRSDGGADLTSGGLARHLDLSAPTMTGIVDRLVDAGLVERRRTADDRRVVEVVATEKGRGFVAEVFAGREDRLRRLFAAMPEDGALALARGLRALHETILAAGDSVAEREEEEREL